MDFTNKVIVIHEIKLDIKIKLVADQQSIFSDHEKDILSPPF